MQKPKQGCGWYYVDESGEPTFYDRNGNSLLGCNGCSPYLILGFVEIPNPSLVRRAILDCQAEVLNEKSFQRFPSLKKTAQELHAKNDHAEVRHLVFERIRALDFKAQFVVARKDEEIFQTHYKGDEQFYYDRLVALLFENILHLREHNTIVFAKRYNKDRKDPLRAAIQQGIERFAERCGLVPQISMEIEAQRYKGEPCLALIDYMLWAVQRVFVRDEWYFYEMLEEKVSMLRILDNKPRFSRSWYNRRNPLTMEKATPPVLGS